MSDPTVFDPRSLPRRALAALHAHRAALTKAADGEHEGATLSVRVGDGDAVDLPPALARVVAAGTCEVSCCVRRSLAILYGART